MNPPSRTHPTALRSWNPLDHLRLLGWVFFAPHRLAAYRRAHGEHATKGIGTLLASILLWLPLAVPILALGIGALPGGGKLVPVWIIAAGMLVGWALTNWLGTLEYPDITGWREEFGPVFEGAFLIVFGLAFGVAFGLAFITGLDLMDIVVVEQVLGKAGLIAVVASFGVSFGVAYIVADRVAFGGAFIFAPLLAMCVTGFVAFGVGFVGAFVAIFLITFGIAFTASFAFTFALTALVVNRLERWPDSPLARGLRIGGLVGLALAHAALVWICLLGGWRVLAG